MMPTIKPDKHVLVNCLKYGTRVFDCSPDSVVKHGNISRKQSKTVPARKDINVFNYPFGYDDWSRIEFKINYVYCKRVAGTPGDTVTIIDGITHNNNYEGIIGVYKNQLQLQSLPDSIFWSLNIMTAIPLSKQYNTIKNIKPLYIPAKGGVVELNDINRELYGLVIQYETGSFPSDSVSSYTFIHDYYFVLGDNSCDSRDSRYIGFIPDDFIVGIVGGRKVGKVVPFVQQAIQ